MSLVETYLPFGIRDVKITPFIGELGVGTPVDLPVGRVVTFRETEAIELLKSDDRNVAMEGTGPMVEWELEAGGISFEAWQVLTGANLVSGAGFRELIKLDTDVRPYFVIEGQSINTDGSDIHVIIRRCKVSGAVEGTFEEGTFFLTQCEGLGIGDSSGELWRMRWNQGPTTVFGGIRILPNNIQIQARSLTISTGNVVGASLVPAVSRLEANRLQVGTGTEIVIALQPRAVNMTAVPLTVSGGVGAVTLAPASRVFTAVPFIVSTGVNLVPKNLAMTAQPLLVGSTSTIVQAESGTVEGQAVITAENAGYTGTGYIGFYGLTGDVNQVNFSATVGGLYTFSIRYANAGQPPSDTVVNIRVNGGIQGTLTLTPTGTDWESPTRFAQSAAITIPLNAGNNVIRIEHAGLENTYADLDSYTFTGAGGGGSGALPPVAEFTINPSSGQVGQTIQFNDQTVNVPTSWAWLFGDGASSTLQSPSHSYAGAATYNVQLTATNAQGSNSITHSIVITSGGGGGTPDYVVGVNGTLQQILELSYAQLANKLVLVPSGTWMQSVTIDNKDFGGLRVEFAAGSILRSPDQMGIRLNGSVRNLILFGPGAVQISGFDSDGSGIFIDGSYGDGGGCGNITIDGLTVEPIPGTGAGQRDGIHFWHGDRFIVRNCTIHDFASNAKYGFNGAGSGLSIGASRAMAGGTGHRVIVENNHIYNILKVQDGDSADRNGIIFDLYHGDLTSLSGGRSIGSTLIQGNNIHDVSGRGIQILIGGTSDSQFQILQNTVYGQWARHLAGSNPEAAIGVFGGYPSSICGNILVSNNVVTTDAGNGGKPAYSFHQVNVYGGFYGTGNTGNFVQTVNSNAVPGGFLV